MATEPPRKMASLSSATTTKRKSIGLANLMDALPTATAVVAPARSPKKPTPRSRRQRRKRAGSSSTTPTTTPAPELTTAAVDANAGVLVSTTVIHPPDDLNATVAKDVNAEIRHADPTGDDTNAVSPPSSPTAVDDGFAACSGLTAAELFDAIAIDAFFELVAVHGIELYSGDPPTASSSTTPTTATRIDVNDFRDPLQQKTLLHQACRHANLEIVKCLLYNGARPLDQCAMGRTAFHEVVSSGRRDAVLGILEALHAHDPRGLAIVDVNGTHVVHLASIHGCVDVLAWCATIGQQPLAMTSFSGRNCLHYAAYNGRLPVLEFLLLQPVGGQQNALSIAALDANGYSVLHYAAMGGHLELCQWLVLWAPRRRDLSVLATNSDGQTAIDVARVPEIQAFLEDAAQVPPAPIDVRCIGADNSSLGITWTTPSVAEDPDLLEVLAPTWCELEYCKKPKGLRRASAVLAMLMLLPTSTAHNATASAASSYLLDWQKLSVRIEASATEHWLSGLEADCEYLVRVRVWNRNGCGEYSIPDLSSEFRTTSSSTASGISKSSAAGSLFGSQSLIKAASSGLSFIGTIDLEILEARRLLFCEPMVAGRSSGSANRREAAECGRFYAVLKLDVPTSGGDELEGDESRRRGSLNPFFRFLGHHGESRHRATRRLYQVRTDYASVQDDLVLSGSLHAFRHPRFGLCTSLRVPESMDAVLSIEVLHETASGEAAEVVGRVQLPLLDLVRGFPAKLRWLELHHRRVESEDDVQCPRERPHGELLVRSLFLADGITRLPHPTLPDTYCSTAEELLHDHQLPADMQSHGDVTDSQALQTASPVSSLGRSQELDAMGFRISPPGNSFSSRAYAYFYQHQQCMAQQQERLWRTFHRHVAVKEREGRNEVLDDGDLRSLLQPCGDYDPAVVYEPSAFRNSSRLRRLVWDGIPPSARRILYLRMSGAEAKRRGKVAGYYHHLLRRVLKYQSSNEACDGRPAGFEGTKKQIQVDLKRTFAGNQSWINTAQGQSAMERVLLAYAVHNEVVGYCQSMSFIVGRLLCLFRLTDGQDDEDEAAEERLEEDVFWILAVLCEDFFGRNYSKGMEGLHVDGLVLESLLQRRLPKVMRHIQVTLHNPLQMGLLLVTGWLLPVFCAVFPSETSFRLLDVVFYEGPTVVFALVLALLRMAQPQLLTETKDYMQLFRFLKERDQRLHDTALLMEIALDEHLLLAETIPELRVQCQQQHERQRPHHAQGSA